jgi:ribosome-binding factor A
MSVDRLLRVNELLKRELGDALFRVLNEPGVDLGGVTITHVVCSKDLSRARVLVSVREAAGRERALAALRRRRADLQSLINADLMLKRTPVLQFELDPSLEEGDRVLALLAGLEPVSDPDEASAPDPAGGPVAP